MRRGAKKASGLRSFITVALSALVSFSSLAATIQNTVTGTHQGVALDGTFATVTLNLNNTAVSGVLAEISPTIVAAGGTAVAFTYDLLPTIGAGDSGIDEVTLTAPAGYANIAMGSVGVGGSALTLNCPAPGAGQYCATVAGQTITLRLGSKITVTGTNIRLGFSADAPAVTSSAAFGAAVDDSTTAAAAQGAVPGDADGDGADANSQTINVVPRVTFTAASQSGAENAGTITVTAQLSAISGVDVTVPYTISGSAASPADYTLPASPLTIAAGGLSADITIAVNDDAFIEAAETVVVTMGTPTNALAGATAAHTLTINDNDAAGVNIAQSGGGTAVTEGGATDSYTLALNSVPNADVSVTVDPDAQTDLGAGAGNSITLTFTPANWNIAQTVTVSAVNDTVAEGAHISTITHTAASSDAGYDGIALANVAANVTDNDAAGITLIQSGGGTDVAEGGASDAYTVVLNSQPTADVTVTVTPDAQTDLGAGAGTAVTLTFTPGNWNAAQTVTVTAANDAVIEGAHTSTLAHAVASGDANYNGLVVADVTANITDDDAAGVAIAPPGGTSVAEGGATASYTLVLNTPPGANVTITVDPDTQSDLGAGAGNAIALTFTPANWNIAQTVTVTAVNDPVAEGGHTSTITHTAASADGNYNGLAIANVVANVLDNDAGAVIITPSGGGSAVTEGGAADTYSLALASLPAANVAITVDPDAQTDLGAGAGNAIALTFTPANWNIAQTITIAAVDDTVAEGPHTSILTHTAASADAAYDGIAISNLTASVIDNDVAGVALAGSGGGTAVTEGGANDTYTLVLNTPPGANVTVTVDPDAQTDVGAGAGNPVALTFTPANWNVPQTVTVTAIDDAVAEGAHTSSITHTAVSGDASYDGIAIPALAADVADDDTALIGFAAADSGGAENVALLNIAVNLTIPSTGTITVDYGVNTASTAAGDGIDYALAAGTLTFNPGETSKNIVLAVSEDALNEAAETVVIDLGNPANAMLGAQVQHTYTIADNDPLPGVSFTATSSNGAESSSPATLAVALSGPSGQAVAVDYGVNAVSTATGGGTDYALAAGTLAFNPGETVKTISIAISNDIIDEANETVVVDLANPANAVPGAVTQHAYTITDDDTAGVAITPPTGSTAVAEGGAAGSYTIVLGTQPSADVTITVTPDAQTDLGAGAGTSIALTFTAGNWNTPQTITVTAVDDAVAEGAHVSNIAHAAASADANYNGLTIPGILANITDNDVAAVSFAAAASGGDEGVTPASVVVTLSLSSSRSVSVNYAVDAASTATGEADYTLASGTLTFEPGEVSKTLDVAIAEDALDEYDETVVLNLTTAVNGVPGAITQHVYTIADNDALPTVAFNAASHAASEALTAATLTATLSAPSGRSVSVDYAFDAASTATAGADLDLAAGTLVFNPGETGKTIAVAVINDNVVESDETVVIALSNPLNATLGAPALHTYTIQDNDTARAVSRVGGVIAPGAVPLATSTVPFIVTLTPAIHAGDTGLNQIVINVPAGYSNIVVTGVDVGDSVLIGQCPAPAAGQYCGAVSGQTITVTLGAYVSTDSTPIVVRFTADTPSALGSGSFDATVDDIASAAAPQSVDFGSGGAVQVVRGVDPLRSRVTAEPSIVLADGTAAATLTATLHEAGSGAAAAGKRVSFATDRGAFDDLAQPSAASDTQGRAAGQLRSKTPGIATVTAAVASDQVTLAARPVVYFTQGRVLDITKLANKKEGVVGDVVTYELAVRNLTHEDVVLVTLEDRLPPNFKYLKGSMRLDGRNIADPPGNRTLSWNLGTIPAWVDANGNGRADPGEPGFLSLTYQLQVGAGAQPGEYENRASARDVCAQCLISNVATARVEVTLDPLFDLGAVIGKVYEDTDRDGVQDDGEAGVRGAMVVMDTGVYALTDEHGRYHFPAVQPGAHLIKINLQALAVGARATTGESVVANITPGLLAKANFGVQYRLDELSIGRPAGYGVAAQTATDEQPGRLVGNVRTLSALLNGTPLVLPGGEARLQAGALDDVIQIENGQLSAPVSFVTEIGGAQQASAWTLTLWNARGGIVRELTGEGAPPAAIPWDARNTEGQLAAGGEIYQYQLSVRYRDGGQAASTRRLFGVNRSSAISLHLTGAAFKANSAELNDQARRTLNEAAAMLRQFPDETVLVEGHTDSSGKAERNLELSAARARAAADYLIRTLELPPERFVVRGVGAAQPLASNAVREGRELNRRVEIKGLVGKVERVQLTQQYRGQASAELNGQALPVQPSGHFVTEVDSAQKELTLAMTDEHGRRAATTIAVPTLEILQPGGELRLPYGSADEAAGYALEQGENGEPKLKLQLRGRTDAGNAVQLDGEPLTLSAEGLFTAELRPKLGDTLYGLTVRNKAGYTRLMDLKVRVQDRVEGELLLLVEPVPQLSVKLPPPDAPLTTPVLVITGQSAGGNRVRVNGADVETDGEGRFTATVTLPKGRSTLEVMAIDPQGYAGSIRRDIKVTDTKLFLLAFVDGKLGQLQSQGYVEGAGESGLYTEGRLAYYLKGVVAGKYLVTSAFDSGVGAAGELLANLDDANQRKLLTRLDPDKIYPVYGDASTLVHDAESQGKFYLAVDSDELHGLLGNYPVNFADTELAAYQRTLFGGRVSYQSLARTQSGRHELEAVAFGAEVRQAHMRDELRATGGSLYYLSQRNVIEGSEQVGLIVRDKETGLTLTRLPQQQGRDYTIKYEEGRLLFTRPITSVQEDGRLVDQHLLGGNPVYVEVDYESRLDFFSRTAAGVRARKQLGENIAVGGTLVQDQQPGEPYQLQGVDAEWRPRPGTRVMAEIASSSGTNGAVNVSEDGGLSYRTVTRDSTLGGQAWKATAEVDVGAWLDQPGKYQAGAYLKNAEPGFDASGNASEQGVRKSGVNVNLAVTDKDRVLARHDRSETSSPASPAQESATTTLQAQHRGEGWSAIAEYQAKETEAQSASTVAGKVEKKLGENLTVGAEQQVTLSGEENNQTTVSGTWQPWPFLSLDAKGIHGTLGAAAEFGLGLGLSGRHLYLRQRFIENDQGPGATTVLGGESAAGPLGRVYSEYQWEQAPGGERNVSVLGASRLWDVRPGLRLSLSGEQGSTQQSGTDGKRYSVAAGLSYLDPAGLSAALRGEFRREIGSPDRLQFLSTHSLEYKFSPDYTVLGAYRYSYTRDLARDMIEAEFEERSLGFAYRPVRNDRLNLLGRYTHIADQRPLNLTGNAAETLSKDVFSIEWSYDLRPGLEWVDKLAYKVAEEQTADWPTRTSSTLLSVNRLNYRLRRDWDIGLEYRLLSQQETADRRQGWVTEAMWRAREHMRVGVGFNFTDFSDNEFSENDYSAYGWFLRVQGMY